MTLKKLLNSILLELTTAGRNGASKNWLKICERGSNETRLMTCPLTPETRVKGNGTGIKGTPAVNIELHLAFTVKVINGWKPVKWKTKFLLQKETVLPLQVEGHGANIESLLSRPYFRCKSRHHTSLSDRHSINGLSHGSVFTTCSPGWEDQPLPVIIPPKIQEIVGLFWHGHWEEFHIKRISWEAESASQPRVTPNCHYQRCPETVPAHIWSETWWFGW